MTVANAAHRVCYPPPKSPSCEGDLVKVVLIKFGFEYADIKGVLNTPEPPPTEEQSKPKALLLKLSSPTSTVEALMTVVNAANRVLPTP